MGKEDLKAVTLYIVNIVTFFVTFLIVIVIGNPSKASKMSSW